jgi:two-component system cell cycle response regulator DivK
MKILIVEDNEPLGALLARRLEKRGHQVIVADDEGEAQASAKAFHPDIVIVEAQLRGGEDWSAARRLKFDDQTRDIPILGLVPNASDAARALAMQNGCAELQGKPVDFFKLLLAIAATAATPESLEA